MGLARLRVPFLLEDVTGRKLETAWGDTTVSPSSTCHWQDTRIIDKRCSKTDIDLIFTKVLAGTRLS